MFSYLGAIMEPFAFVNTGISELAACWGTCDP